MACNSFLQRTQEHPEGSSDVNDEEETEIADTTVGEFVDRKTYLSMLDENDDLDARESTVPLECPPGCALAISAPPGIDSSLVKGHIMPRLGLGWVKASSRDGHRPGRA